MGTTPGGLPYPDLDDTPDLSYWNQQLAQAVEARISSRPRCKILAAAAQSVPNNATTQVDFNGGTVVYDTNGMADIANDAIVIKTAGLYRLSARIVYATNGTGYRTIVVARGSGLTDVLMDDYRAALPSPAPGILTAVSEPIALAVNDSIRLHSAQTSGGALNLTAANGAARYSHLAADWVAGQ